MRSAASSVRHVSRAGIKVKGVSVIEWQTWLKRNGFFTGTPRGNYGELTRTATAAFQSANYLPATGSLDRETYELARLKGFGKAAPKVGKEVEVVVAVYSQEKFPQTRWKELTLDEVGAYSDEDLKWAINEMYARHGFYFKDEALRNRFKRFTWYKPDASLSMADVVNLMSPRERANLAILAGERRRRNLSG